MKPPMNPVVWAPPPVARRSPVRTPLPALERIDLPACGEDVVVDAQGRLITGLEDGRVLRLDRTRGTSETLVNTGGRPMCIEIDAEQRLVVCDAKRGLLRVDVATRRIEVLVHAGVHQLGLCNNAAIARDGSIYFSDSSRRFSLEHWRGDILEHSGTGRLLKRTPDGQVEVLLDNLQFANGVALAADESFVAVAETGAYRIARHWLSGPRQGQSDMLIDRLPGFPDNMSSDHNGLIWVALASRRNRLLDFLHRSAPVLRRIVWALPTAMQPKPPRGMCVLAIDAEGHIVRNLVGRSEAFHMVTGLRAHGDELYLASLQERALAALKLA
jgi:sugar lactone lactonase YvrE